MQNTPNTLTMVIAYFFVTVTFCAFFCMVIAPLMQEWLDEHDKKYGLKK